MVDLRNHRFRVNSKDMEIGSDYIYIYILYVPYLFSVSNVGPEIHDLYRYKWLKLFAASRRMEYLDLEHPTANTSLSFWRSI